MGWPKGRKRSRETIIKMKEAAKRRYAKNKIGIIEIAKKIKDEDRETWKKHEEEEKVELCPFCGRHMKPLFDDYYYCDICKMIINPALRWRVKLP
jgi:hypothetical protein